MAMTKGWELDTISKQGARPRSCREDLLCRAPSTETR